VNTNPGFKVTVYTHKSNITKTVGFMDKVTTLPQTPSWIIRGRFAAGMGKGKG